MKHATWIVCLAVLAVSDGDAWAQHDAAHLAVLRELAGTDEARCASVTVSSPFDFHGRRLNEIPDIREPELRLANELMSNGCFSRAFDNLDVILEKDPDNQNAKYIVARMTWMRMGHRAAEPLLIRALEEFHNFPSAVVLLAGVRYADERHDDAARLLDAVEPTSPTDLWIFMNRLRLEAVNSPTPALRTRLIEIVRSKAFPPNAREIAGSIAAKLPNQSSAELEEVLRMRLDIESSVGMACKASELASWLSDVEERFPDVIELLESPRAKQGNCFGLKTNRTLLAQAYLVEAIKISPRLVPGNQKHFDRANALVGGDFDSVVTRAHGGPNFSSILTFLQSTKVN
jgi:tetratricopeptide (TPR) repeat protein